MYYFKCRCRLGQADIYCVHAFFATLGVKRDLVTFADAVNQAAYVNKNFLFGGGIDNEAKTFGLIKELYGSIVHW